MELLAGRIPGAATPAMREFSSGLERARAPLAACLLLFAAGSALALAPDIPDQCAITAANMAAAIVGEDAVDYDRTYRAPCPGGQAPAFPGARGFGACATGGRGGRVIEVTSLAATRDPGTLQWALDQTGPRIIVFRVSGVIDRAMEITHGDVTIAGQSSPGGITVRGILCDNQVYETSTCTNVIIRHIRSRPAATVIRPGQAYILDDAIRIDGGQRVIVDHLSLSGAEDETFQLSRASDITVQNSMLSELMGSHEWSGMLINYSSEQHPLLNLSLHHNVWNRQQGRMPEISCAPNPDDDSPPNCAHRLSIEISNNLTWDQGSEIVYNSEDGLRLDLNWVGNMGFNRPTYTQPLINDSVFDVPDNRVYVADDRYAQFPQLTNYALAGCCNDWASHPEESALRPVPSTVVGTRIELPEIAYIPSVSVPAYAVRYMGAFPRDAQDRRLLYPVAQRRIATNAGWGVRSSNPCGDSFATDVAPAPLPDSDHDGMPDAWEVANGLDPTIDDSAGDAMAARNPLYAGMTNIEAYLHERHVALLFGDAPNNYARTYVQKAYVAYYGRPADPQGLAYWVARMDADGGSLDAIIAAFGTSNEFDRRYGHLSVGELVTRIYQQALNREPDPEGLAFYLAEIESGRRTTKTITLNVLDGATTSPDSTIVANKLAVADHYTAKVAAGCPYGTESDGVDALSDVTDDAATVAAAKAAIDRQCETR